MNLTNKKPDEAKKQISDGWDNLSFSLLSPSVSRVGLVSGEDLRGCSGGASQDSPDTVLLQTLQRPGTPPSSRQHLLRLQGQPGNLPAGRSHSPLCSTAYRSLFGRDWGHVLVWPCGWIHVWNSAFTFEKLAAFVLYDTRSWCWHSCLFCLCVEVSWSWALCQPAFC